jgi:mannose-1-phosphate guanylyltransferase
MTRAPVHAVVLAGGAGTRFWPLSRQARPKPLLRVAGEGSLLAEAVDRARRVADPGCVWLVCGHDHADVVRREAGLPLARTLVEPRMRNTAAAIGLAAARIASVAPGAVMVVLPADHRVPRAGEFARAMRSAVRAASREAVLVTLGVRPTRAETGYGYIRLGSAVGGAYPGLHAVARFVEKPDLPTAQAFLAGGDHLWNSGMFVWSVRTLLAELALHAPAIARALAPVAGLAARARAADVGAAIAAAYRRVPKAPIDTALLERSASVWCLPVDFRWSDVGTWASLAQEVGVSTENSSVISGTAWTYDAPGNLIAGGDRPIVLLGVRGLAVIDAGDALLVVNLERSGEVRDVVASLRKRRRHGLL